MRWRSSRISASACFGAFRSRLRSLCADGAPQPGVTVDDREHRRPQPARHEIVETALPRLEGLAPAQLQGEQVFVPVGQDADHAQHRHAHDLSGTAHAQGEAIEVEAVVATYLAGGNPRRVRGALQPLLKAAPLSKSAVSRVVATLKDGLEAWRTRSLADLGVSCTAASTSSGGGLPGRPAARALHQPEECAISLFHITGDATGPVVVPAIAIPVQQKPGPEFDECPENHVDVLKACLPSVTKFIVIDWAGKERAVLDMLRASLSRSVLGIVVGQNKADAERIVVDLTKIICGVFKPSTAEGFSDFIKKREVDAFLFPVESGGG
jgi:hypothetical protein